MISRMRVAFANAVQNVQNFPNQQNEGSQRFDSKFPYSRPDFLHLTKDEVEVTADHASRPVVVPRDVSKLPWNAGYAEVINAGKSTWNEDQARAGVFHVHNLELNSNESEEIKVESKQNAFNFTYFSVFDGHAGTGASLMAVNALHNFIQSKLQEVIDLIQAKELSQQLPDSLSDLQESLALGYQIGPDSLDKISRIRLDELVVGALESAFFEMDRVIHKESAQYKISGGCTVLVAMFFLGKLYIANAGDSRAVLCRGTDVRQMTVDCTPESERRRLQLVAQTKPELLQGYFTPLEFQRRITKKDIGSKVLYRSADMDGWAHKVVQEEDLKIPLVVGEGKKARLLATIGVTKGFGDHDLLACDTSIPLKPFLSPKPEVTIYDMMSETHSPTDFLLLGTDGLWDVVPNRRAAMIVQQTLLQSSPDDPLRYTSAAQSLVYAARGSLQRKAWKTLDSLLASYDDITCFVIPLDQYTYDPVQVLANTDENES